MRSTTCLAAIILCAGSAHAYDVNKDLENLGPDAHDLSVILSGSESVVSHFDGYTSGPLQGRFNSFATGPDGANTQMRWQDFDDGGNDMIDTGQKIHVGWSTSDHSSNIKDMYWTDETGSRIPGSIVYNITSDWRYETSTLITTLVWPNLFDELVLVSGAEFAVLDDTVPLEELNEFNSDLVAQLEPVPGASSFEVAPGESVEFDLPSLVGEGQAVVVRYGMFAPGTAAATTDYIQFVVPAPATAALFLLGGGLSANVRRRAPRTR
jgi:hypothetical protein